MQELSMYAQSLPRLRIDSGAEYGPSDLYSPSASATDDEEDEDGLPSSVSLTMLCHIRCSLTVRDYHTFSPHCEYSSHLCHSLSSLTVTHCHCHSLSLSLTLTVTHCHTLSNRAVIDEFRFRSLQRPSSGAGVRASSGGGHLWTPQDLLTAM